MSTSPTVRLHLYFARDSDRAVILRQGPSKLFRMILWHRDTDRFQDGQWLKHKVYAERCALSPDGRHFLYFALNGDWAGESLGSYTALSRPPWFTALALFPEGDTWGGGGRFLDRRHYIASGGNDILGGAPGLVRVRQGERTPENVTGIVAMGGTRAPLPRETRRRLLEGDDWTPPFDQYHAHAGQLFRRHGQEISLIRDFTDMAFEPIAAPYGTGSAGPVPTREGKGR